MEKENALAIQRTSASMMTLNEVKEISQIFIESGLFKDTKEVSQAIVKVMAGQEIGLMPFESMSGLDIISGKIAISGKVMSTKIAESGKYHYRVIEINNEKCSIDFYEGKENIGNSTFTIKDAEKITFWDAKSGKNKKLSEKDTWVNYPRNLLFNRAISNGQRWFTPDVFKGMTVYTYEEMGVDVDGDGEPINITPKPIVERASEPLPVKANPETIIDTDKPKPKRKPKEKPEETSEYLFNKDTILDTPFATLESLRTQARDLGIGKLVKPIFETVVPEFFQTSMDLINLPEDKIIEIVRLLTGVRMEVD